MKKYYEAYDERYRSVHAEGLSWTSPAPTPIVREVLESCGIDKTKRILEIGAGEGRDAFPLLCEGYNLIASDISPEAVDYCRRQMPKYASRFTVLDAVEGTHRETYDFIYAVAVIHMLVEDSDRAAFLSFIREHLCEGGIALVCSMGDGIRTHMSDTKAAFDLQRRIHEQSGRELMLAATTCRMVRRETFLEEFDRAGLTVLSSDVREDVPGFEKIMCALVKRKGKK